nr:MULTISPECIES: NAD+ synthase [unclassified Helicobacter]
MTNQEIKSIIDFLQDTLKQKGFKKAIFGLSGGIDSAVVAVLCKKAFNSNILAVYMPSKNSHSSNLSNLKAFCKDFEIPLQIYPIYDYETIFKQQNPDTLRLGNFYARMRMTLLYDLSQKNNALVIGTSNKSELTLGYGTLYGDLACAINPIAPFYKTQIFKIAKLLNLPQYFLNKAPSADLYPGQSDEKEIGYNYETLDPLLDAIYCKYHSLDNLLNNNYKDLIDQGFDSKMVEDIIHRIQKNIFKQKPPVFFER